MEGIEYKTIQTANISRTNHLIKLRMLLYATSLVIMGKLKLKNLLRYLKRLLLFINKMTLNKYIKVNGGIKINLYVPAFPSGAFFHATHKMLEFEKQMPAITALISVTSACRYNCDHCYQKLDKGKDIDLDLLIEAVRFFQDQGVAFFNIEGGEPFLTYPRLRAVCKAIDHRSEILVNSTGDNMTLEKLSDLKDNCNLLGIMFSLHTADPVKLNRFMKNDYAFSNLVHGIKCCHQTNTPVLFNTCLSKDDYTNGGFEELLELARDLGGSIIQLIKPKGAGGWLVEGTEYFSAADLQMIKEKVIRYNTHEKYRTFPFISAMIIDEDEEHFGCTAGGTDRFYLNAKGDLQACEFLNLSFGNIAEEPLKDIYDRMRKSFRNPGCNWLCELYQKKIADSFTKLKDATLPLPYAITKDIINSEDHGKVPDFYDRANKI